MKLLLVQPPIRDFYDTEIRLQPLGLCLLKAVVKNDLPQIDVMVKDYHQGYGRRTLPCLPELSYLKEYYPYPDASPFSMFHHFYHFGASFEELGRDVAGENPDIVGISSLFTPYAHEALNCAREIKRHLDVPIVMGGPHVTALPLEILKDQSVDFVIRGEGERPLVELLRALESGRSLREVPNLGYKQDGEIILNATGKPYDFTSLPWPDFSDFPPDRYLFEKRPLCFLITSRGCPHRCTFCSVHQTFGRDFRRRTVEDIVSEIKERYRQGYRVFDFEDDNLTFFRDDFRELLLRLIAEVPLEDTQFTAMNGISYMSLDREILELMKAVGFKSLNLSLVTANADTLYRVRRPHTLEKFMEVVGDARGLGLDMVCYQILGLPNETLDDMIRTMVLLSRLPVLIGVSIFYLIPGCSMAGDFDTISPADWIRSRSTAMSVETDHVSRDDLYTLFITARVINFMKGLRTGERQGPAGEALKGKGRYAKREITGLDLLSRLLSEKTLYAATGNGFRPLTRFRADLFLRVWQDTPYHVTGADSTCRRFPAVS